MAASAFPQPPIKQPMMNGDGTMSMEWVTWFSRVFAQISTAAYQPSAVQITGGSIGGNTTIDTTGTITAPTFIGTLQGNAATATNAVAAQNATTAATTSGNAATATLAATATNALACSGNAATATALAAGAGLTVVVATAKLTTGGTNGSMTFTNGVLTAQVAAT